jgi:RNA polymerase sigma factor (sigma-70 family)
MTESAFQQLQQQILADDPRGLSQVFAICSQYCIRSLRKKTQCSLEDAEDVLMEAMLTFRQNMVSGRVENLSNLKAYVFGICWNKWRDLNRARKRWQQEQEEVERTLYWVLEDHDLPFEQEEEARLFQQSLQRKLSLAQEALQELGEKCRQLLRMFYMEERSLQQIAEQMAFANANVVKVSKFRCYQKWMKKMEKSKNLRHG